MEPLTRSTSIPMECVIVRRTHFVVKCERISTLKHQRSNTQVRDHLCDTNQNGDDALTAKSPTSPSSNVAEATPCPPPKKKTKKKGRKKKSTIPKVKVHDRPVPL